MLQNIKQRLGREEEEGFTLIELMVVVLIIAILMAIAIPTFLSARGNAQSKAVEANLHNAITDEQTYFTGLGNGSSYGAAASMTANSIDNSLTWTAGLVAAETPIAPGNVYVTAQGTGTDPQVILSAEGADGNYYYVFDDNGSVTYNILKTALASAPATAAAFGGSTSWPSSAS